MPVQPSSLSLSSYFFPLCVCLPLLPPDLFSMSFNPYPNLSSHTKLVIGYLLWISAKLVAAFPILLLTNIDATLLPLSSQVVSSSLLLSPISPLAVWANDSSSSDTIFALVSTRMWVEQIIAVFLWAVCVRTVCNKACAIWIIECCWC